MNARGMNISLSQCFFKKKKTSAQSPNPASDAFPLRTDFLPLCEFLASQIVLRCDENANHPVIDKFSSEILFVAFIPTLDALGAWGNHTAKLLYDLRL
tara:strand:- start:1765 stop:2058 length:294 start_codon:yes stop_codon:yes gene_type:complete